MLFRDVRCNCSWFNDRDIVSAIGDSCDTVLMCFTGELTVFCDGPDTDRPAECYRTDNSGQSVLTITAHSAGLHSLHVRYNDLNVPGKHPETLYVNLLQVSN